jgi:hypothetical protein
VPPPELVPEPRLDPVADPVVDELPEPLLDEPPGEHEPPWDSQKESHVDTSSAHRPAMHGPPDAGVGVAVDVEVGVGVAVDVEVGVGFAVDVEVGVGFAVEVEVGVGVAVEVEVGVDPFKKGVARRRFTPTCETSVD